MMASLQTLAIGDYLQYKSYHGPDNTKLLLQPTDGMDIFDTFFLVEYLRQWAARGRIVVSRMEGTEE